MSAQYRINFNKHGEGWVVNEEAGENLGIHKLVYRNAAGTWSLADADAVTTMPVLGITIGAVTSGKKGEILLWGYIGDNLTWAWTLAQPIYASTVAGELTQTMPSGIGDVTQVVAMPINDPTMIQFIGSVGAASGGSNTLEGETAFAGFDPSKNHFVNYFLCDGVADDVQINEAIAYVATLGTGGSVFLETGDYDITASVELDSRSITLKGVGRGEDEVAAHNGSCLTPSQDVDVIDISASYCNVTGITIYGDRANRAAGRGIAITAAADKIDILFNRIMFTSEQGIDIETGGCNGINISYNEFREVLETGADTDGAIQATGLGDSIISFNQVSSLKSGISLASSGAVRLIGNDVFPVKYGLYLSVCQRLLVEGNLIEPAIDPLTEQGIQFGNNAVGDWGKYCVFSGNEIHDVVKHGIKLTGAEVKYNIFSDNNIRDCGYYGITLDTCDYNTITDNMIENCSAGGVEISDAGAVSNTVKDNKFPNTANCITDLGTDTAVHEIAIYVKDPNGNIGTHPAVVLTDGVDVVVYDQLQIPLEFQQLVTANIIIVPGGSGDLRRSAASNWGKIGAGEAYNAQTDSIALGTVVGLVQDDLESIDISTLFTAIAAGDLVGFTFTRVGSDVLDDIGADCYYLGGRIRFV